MIKLAACVLLLVAVALAVEEVNFINIPRVDEHNLIRCNSKDQDKWIILEDDIQVKPRKFLQIVEGTVSYPVRGVGKEIITCIRVIDLEVNGTGGYPEILEGGIDFKYVVIRFVSQRNYGYKFEVQIWGM